MTLLPEYRAQLHTAAHRRARSRRRQLATRLSRDGRLNRVATAIPAMLSVLIAVAIAAVAIVTLSHGHRPSPAGAPAGSSRNALVQTLGVLRRAQTNADRLAERRRGMGGAAPGAFFSNSPSAERTLCRGAARHELQQCALRLDKPLVRTVVRDGYHVAIFPTVVTYAIRQARPGEGILMTLHGPGIYFAGTSLTPTGAQTIRARGLLVSAYAAAGVNRGVMLVPDGVAKVTLDHFRLLAPNAVSLPQVPPGTSTVSDNVALLQFSRLTEQSLNLNPKSLGRYFSQGSGRRCKTTFAIYALPATAQMTWADASGQTMRHITISLRLYVGTDHPASGTTPRYPRCGAPGP